MTAGVYGYRLHQPPNVGKKVRPVSHHASRDTLKKELRAPHFSLPGDSAINALIFCSCSALKCPTTGVRSAKKSLRAIVTSTSIDTIRRVARRLRVQILVVILALRRKLDVFVPGLGILEDFSFVIPDHDLFVVVVEDVAGIDWDFAAAAGRVDDELRNSIASGVTAQAFNDLNAFRDRSAHVR